MECYVPSRKGLHLFGLLTAKKVIVSSGKKQHRIVGFFKKIARDVVWVLVGVFKEIGEAADRTPENFLFPWPDHGIDWVL